MNAPDEATPRPLPQRWGIILAAAFILLATAVYAVIASQPADDGLEWIPLVLLAMPWFKLGQNFLIPGILINATLLYLCGILLQLAWRTLNKAAWILPEYTSGSAEAATGRGWLRPCHQIGYMQ